MRYHESHILHIIFTDSRIIVPRMGSLPQIFPISDRRIAIRSARQACIHTDSTPDRERRSHGPDEEGFQEDYCLILRHFSSDWLIEIPYYDTLGFIFLALLALYDGGSECLSAMDQFKHGFQRDGSLGNPRKAQEVTDRETLVPWVEPEKFARVA